METLALGKLTLTVGQPETLFHVADAASPDSATTLAPPEFEIDGALRSDWVYAESSAPRELPHGGAEHTLHFTSAALPTLKLAVTVRSFPGSPFLRFRYTLTSDAPATLTKGDGRDNLCYFSLPENWDTAYVQETQLSSFEAVVHSYLPNTIFHEGLMDGQRLAGPIVQARQGKALLAAYEHGADCPDTFLEWVYRTGETFALELRARKGNYYHNQPVSAENPFTSVWFELGLSAQYGLAEAYRTFFLDEVSENLESRQPYLFYNTWNFQERQKYWNGKPYLSEMNFDRMSAEIDAAHAIGIDVFVIDTGWYGKTGDWKVNLERFPDGLQEIKRKLDGYGMKLGLWFNPIVAAKTSEVFVQHPEYVMQWEGKENFWGEIWETEESYGMCLASDYADTFVETLVRLHRELGVVYFKWDAVGQYGCDSARHRHGTAENTPQERADCYAYESGRAMIRIVEAVSRRCPDVIVDFDITEGGRFVGLGFLSVGKYFLVNNGPYFQNFDIPKTTKMEPDTINVFFYPGAARARVCRTGARYDEVIPSILFLTHYLPDPPRLSQANSLASLMLGGNGIWGDLVALSPDDVAALAEPIRDYKRVARAVTRAFPKVTGFAGSCPEVHEKLDAESASGIVVFFTHTKGTVTHVTNPLNAENLREVKGADSWELLHDNRVRLTVTLETDGAKTVFFFGTDDAQ